MKKLFISFLLIFFTTVSLIGNDELYILPKESKKVFKELEKLIENSENRIDIAVYNFEYKKIAKLLKKAAKSGVKVNILFEKSKLENKKTKYDYLCNEKNIKCKVVKDKKQHIKLMIFDSHTAVLGSANLTKESFKENYELLYFSKSKETIKKLENFFHNFF